MNGLAAVVGSLFLVAFIGAVLSTVAGLLQGELSAGYPLVIIGGLCYGLAGLMELTGR